MAISHGEMHYQHEGENFSACLFLSEEGYSLAAFQVRFFLFLTFLQIFYEIVSSPQISFFLSSYIIPLTLISLLYLSILIRLWKGVPGSKVSSESRKGKKRVTRMVVIVVLAFAICWCPIQVSNLLIIHQIQIP